MKKSPSSSRPPRPAASSSDPGRADGVPVTVYHLITRLIVGGAQENTLATCAGLRARGYRVRLLSGPPLGPEGSLYADALAGGIPVTFIPTLRRRIDPWRDLRSLLAISRLLRRDRPDILHTHSAKAGIIGRAAAALVRHRPLVIHGVHGLPFHPWQARPLNDLYILLERLAARVTDGFLPVAEAMTVTSLAARIGRREQYHTVYSGFDVAEFAAARRLREQARRRFALPAAATVIGKVARLFELKGHHALLRAFAAVRDEFPAAHLLLVGDGPLRGELEEAVRKQGLAGAVTFAGLLPPREIPAALAAMDLLVHASLREGLPRAVTQAMAAGVPVVAVDVDGAGEVVHEGVTGRLVPPGDEAALFRAITAALRDPAGSARLARAAAAHVRRAFTVERMVSDTAAAYRDLLAATGRRRRKKV